jgi:xylulokinase
VLVAGVDSSTQSCKVVICDADDGHVVGTGTAPHPLTSPPRSEQDPQAWYGALSSAWATAVTAATGSATTGTAVTGTAVTGTAGSLAVGALSVAAQQHGLVALDDGGQPVHPAKLWNDTEAAPESAALIGALGAAAWAAACGSVPTAAFTIAKLAWLRHHRPAAWARVVRVLLPHDWLTWQLLGRPDRPVTDRGDASGTGWWSPRLGALQPELLALVEPDRDLGAWMPDVLGPSEPAGTSVAMAAGAVVGPGTGDNMSAALALALSPGDTAVSFGTSGTVFGVSEVPTADASGAVAGFADASGRFLPLVCTLNCTKVTDWLAAMLDVDTTGLDRLAANGACGGGGVVLVPYLAGERTPNRPDASGVLEGLRTSTTRSDLARAGFEGVVCGLLDGVDALRAAGVPNEGRLVVAGGGARSRTYPQALADLAQRPVEIADASAEWVALGAAVQAAAVATGRRPEEVAADWDAARASSRPAPVVIPRVSAEQAAEVRAAYIAARG